MYDTYGVPLIPPLGEDWLKTTAKASKHRSLLLPLAVLAVALLLMSPESTQPSIHEDGVTKATSRVRNNYVGALLEARYTWLL